ncbi:MAG: WD40 repeat domain-containing protein, partial [Candidatus Helarchaeales archaeon]
IISGSADRTIKIWDVETGSCLRTLFGHSDAIISVAVTRDGKRIVSGSADKTIKVWDLISGNLLMTLEGHSDNVTGVVLTPDE